MIKQKKSGKPNLLISSSTKDKSSEPQTMDDLLAQTGYSLHGFKRGDTVEGTVVSITPSEILIDIGYKSLGIVSEREMDMAKGFLGTLKVGDKIPVQIVSPESEAGQLILSVRRAGMDKKWLELADKKAKEETVGVVGVEVTRGGLLVDWQGLRGFVPGSQLSPSRAGKAESGIGQNLTVLVLDVDKSTNRLVFSEKRASGGKKVNADLSKIEIGKTYDGVVSGIVPFGIFVNVTLPTGESLEGLVHISEIAWEKVQNPNDYFKSGQKVKAIVISTDQKSGKINLSIKQLTSDPWQELVKKYTLEQQVEGKVVKVSSFGVFVELEKGLDGLIHISKIPPGVEFKEGEKVNCVIEGIDNQKRKLSLALVLKEKPVGYR